MKNIQINKIFQEFFTKNDLDSPLIIACSGGSDSLSLLSICQQALPNAKLICAHFNHRWTSSSVKAVNLVKDFCEKSSIEFILGEAEKAGQNSEEKARNERYAFLKKVAEKYQAKLILTAHHLNDQIETFFFRLLRGSSLNGLSCMKERRPLTKNIILARPLLKFSKEDLMKYCQEQNLEYYEDPSNKQNDLRRNQIRNSLIPIIEEIQPAYKKHILNLIEMTSNTNQFLQEQTESLPRNCFIENKAFSQQPIALQRLILKELAEKENSMSLSFERIEKLRKEILNEKNFRISVSKNHFFESNAAEFKFTKKNNEQNSSYYIEFQLSENEVIIPNFGKVIISENIKAKSELPKIRNSYEVFLDLTKLQNQKLCFRSRLAGDRFCPLNSVYEVKLKKFLIDRKAKNFISSNELIVLAKKNSAEILWIPGIEISDSVKVETKSTHSMKFVPSKSI